MADDHEFDDLIVSARRNYTGELLEVGVTIDGAFFPLGALKVPEFEASRKEARDAQAEADRAAAEQ